MTVYDDPKVVADILRNAMASAEEHAQNGARLGLDVLSWAAKHLDKLVDADEAEDCAEESERSGLGYDIHRYVFCDGYRKNMRCMFCWSQVERGDLEDHVQFHIGVGQFPKPSAIARTNTTEVWAHQTTQGWVTKTLQRREGYG